MPTADVNKIAVLVAALATFILGAFWYSPLLFARQWMQAQGYTPEKLEQMKKRRSGTHRCCSPGSGCRPRGTPPKSSNR